ncbi:Uncharacterised protein [uncultured archaeon]|nr:Uncharacterised protein [uncultured archaeon]
MKVPKTTNAVVSIEVPIQTNQWIIHGLHKGVAPMDYAHLDETLVCYSMFLSAQDNLEGNPIIASKNKVSSVCCRAFPNSFLISTVCQKTLTSCRKCASIVLKSMKPSSIFSIYSELCKRLDVKADRDYFNFAVNEINKKLSSVDVLFLGQMSATQEKVNEIAEVINGKLVITQVSDKGKKREPIKSDVKISDVLTEIDTSPMMSFLLKQFIISKLKGMKVMVTNGKLYFQKERNKKVASLAKDALIERFTNKLGKTSIMDILLYHALSKCIIPHSLVKTTLEVSKIKSDFKKHLSL